MNLWIPKRFFLYPLILGLSLLSLLAGLVFGVDVDDLIFEAADAHYKGNLDEAIRKFETAVSRDKHNQFAHNQLGLLYAKKELYDKAFQSFSLVAGLDEQNTFAQMWMGILYLQKDDLNSAFERFNRIIAVDPNHAEAYYFLGAIYNIRHNTAMAIEYLKKARDADSGEADTHYRLGKAFHNVDMVINARLEYLRVLEINPGYTRAMNELGWLDHNVGDLNAAIGWWRKTIQVNEKDRDAAMNLAKAYNDIALRLLENGDKTQAIDYWNRTLSVEPGNKAAEFYLKKYKTK